MLKLHGIWALFCSDETAKALKFQYCANNVGLQTFSQQSRHGFAERFRNISAASTSHNSFGFECDYPELLRIDLVNHNAGNDLPVAELSVNRALKTPDPPTHSSITDSKSGR